MDRQHAGPIPILNSNRAIWPGADRAMSEQDMNMSAANLSGPVFRVL